MNKKFQQLRNNKIKDMLDKIFVVLLFIVFLPMFISCENRKDEVLKISLLSSIQRGEGKFYAGAFFRALHDVNNNSELLPNHTLDYLFADTADDTLKSLKAMVDMYINETVAYIGPEGTCATEASLASSLNLPMIAHRCHDSKLSKQGRLRRTIISTQPTTSKISKFIMSLLSFYEWETLTMVIENSTKWNETAKSFYDMALEHNINVKQRVYFTYPRIHINFESLLETTYRHTRNQTQIGLSERAENTYTFFTLNGCTRHLSLYNQCRKSHFLKEFCLAVYVFLGDNHALIDFARVMDNKPETSTGDYVVIAADDRPSTKNDHMYFLKTPYETLDDPHTEKRINAFKNVLIVAPREQNNPKWAEFLDYVRVRNIQEPINAPTLPYKNANLKLDVPIYAAYLYDAVVVYANALTKVIQEGGSVRNGSAVVEKIRSKSFQSIQGFQFYIDKDGEAEGNYTVLSLSEPDAKNRSYFKPVGYFQFPSGEQKFPEYIPPLKEYWENGNVPKDEPDCGFENERCQDQYEPDWRTGTICSVVAAAVFVASIFICRHYLYEQKLARLLWKIEYKDLVLVNSVDEIIPPPRPKRKSHTSWRFLISGDEPERATLLGSSRQESFSKQKKVHVGSYKGTIVCIKQIFKKNIDINRTLKKELQLRKELNHDNINRFIGACVEQPHLYIVTQYCARGSLYDILHNEDLNLDDMFIASLVSDLIKGMMFIHESEIISHGNLKSTNCVVDSRWVLQISDFGFQQLVNRDSPQKTDGENYYKGLLWRAPELLRDPNLTGTSLQKCDVYSFAIILYELVGKNGPWGKIDLSPKEIIQKVKNGNNTIPFRPDLSKLVCNEFVKQCTDDCLSDNPDFRPEFKYIRYRLKPMQRGLKANIFDNMLAIMEKYANNLEALVAERTEQLSEEKKMTENLLYRMLPRSVANRLKRGLSMPPESYDCVTLYFSDIVGFTALSAQSTPMQVIDMLNELYTCFDDILGHYDVYKVETIGDAYMVVSGLPIRNGDMHAGEIASMSLHLLKAIMAFKIAHKPEETLKLRIGIHSGPCVAGVVGLKMPRFTLFGDTVNTASRMETTGVALKIHCSKEFKDILQKLGGYTLAERGYVSMKGKGEQFTYFLEDEDPLQRVQRNEKHFNSKQNGQLTQPSGSLCDEEILHKIPSHKVNGPNGVTDQYCNMQILQELNSSRKNPKTDVTAQQNNTNNISPCQRITKQGQTGIINNNIKSNLFSSVFYPESEEMPLMNVGNGTHAYVGPDTTADEMV